MKISLIKFLLTVLILSSALSSIAQIDSCENKVKGYIINLKTILEKFIPDPGSDDARQVYIESIQKINPALFSKAQKLVNEGNSKMNNDSKWLRCFQNEFTRINPSSQDLSTLNWFAYLAKQTTAEFVSPEFANGFGFHIDVNQGVADVGKKTETYSFAARGLLSYTFKNFKANKSSGGHSRVLFGISTYYQNNKFLLFANPRYEYKIRDIGNKLTSIGNLKFIADANVGDTWVIGGGLGIELYNFGLQLLYQRQTNDLSSHILTGLFYRFKK